MMSPEEVRDIMNMYTFSIQNCKSEVDYYNNRVADLVKNRDRLHTHNEEMAKEQKVMTENIAANQEEVDRLNLKLVQIKEKYNQVEATEDVLGAKNLIEGINNCTEKWEIGEDGESKRKALEQFLKIVNTLENDRESIAKLEDENLKLKEDEVVKETTKKFNMEMLNQKYKNEPFYYHPGLLRFFSCRGCGGDEYYNCCQKCQKCNPGCRVNQNYPGPNINTI